MFIVVCVCVCIYIYIYIYTYTYTHTHTHKLLIRKSNTVRIYSQDVGMEFGIEKYAMLIMRSGKQHEMEGIELPNQEKKSELLEKRKITFTWEYWKQTLSKK